MVQFPGNAELRTAKRPAANHLAQPRQSRKQEAEGSWLRSNGGGGVGDWSDAEVVAIGIAKHEGRDVVAVGVGRYWRLMAPPS